MSNGIGRKNRTEVLKHKSTRFIRYCSWEQYQDAKGKLIKLEKCIKPSVSRQFDITTCTCRNKDHCNHADGVKAGNWSFVISTLIICVIILNY